MYLTFVYVFTGFHRMWNEELSPEDNHSVFGKCANAAGHGHTYRAEITLAGEVSGEKPFVSERWGIEDLKKKVLDPALQGGNMDDFVGVGRVSSGENIAAAIRDLIASDRTHGAGLVAVKVRETGKNSFACTCRDDVERGTI